MTDYSINQIAEVCHEANRAVQYINGETEISPPWLEAPVHQRASAIYGVNAALEGQTPQELHESWLQEKIRDGWVYGLIKDTEAKTHPCIVDYALLPTEQKLKDYIFQGVVQAFVKADAESPAFLVLTTVDSEPVHAPDNLSCGCGRVHPPNARSV